MSTSSGRRRFHGDAAGTALADAVTAVGSLHQARYVLFDNGTRTLFATHFETDWDPYIDDTVLIVGMPAFLDWAQHTVGASGSSRGPRRTGSRRPT